MINPQRLGKNLGSYFGERIEIPKVLLDLEAIAEHNGWSKKVFHQTEAFKYLALTRPAKSAQPLRVYISAGIHGDEPAGPLAALRLLKENKWPENVSIWLCPCLNPVGFTLNRRENGDGID